MKSIKELEKRRAWVAALPGAQFHEEGELEVLVHLPRRDRRAAGSRMRRALRQAQRAVRRAQKKGTL
jgi:hypothetical protein